VKKLVGIMLCLVLLFGSMVSWGFADEPLLGDGMTIYIQMGGFEGGPATLPRTTGAREAARHLGVRLIEQYSQWQPEVMVRHFQEAIAAMPDGIVIMGHPGSDAFAPFVEEAFDLGIIVTSGNTPLDALQEMYQDRGFGYAGVELYIGGYITGQAMVRAGLEPGDKALVYGLFAQAGRGESPKGLAQALEDAGVIVDRVEISPEVDADASLCIPILTAYLEANPDTKAMGTQHGAVTAQFANVLKGLGKAPGEIICGGIDLAPAVIESLQEGYVTATLDQQLYLQGFLPILQIVLSKNYQISGLSVNTGAGVVTPETIDALIPLIEAGIR